MVRRRPVYHEVEIGPGLTEEDPALELLAAVPAEERDGRGRQSHRSPRAVRLSNCSVTLRNQYPLSIHRVSRSLENRSRQL
jgi:hypothetical protein